MKKLKKIALAATCLTLCITTSALASAMDNHPAAKNVKELVQVGSLPFQMVVSDHGTFFMSSEGRYVIQGTLQDMWADGKPLRTPEELRMSVRTLDMAALGMAPSDLLSIQYGNGPKDVTIFVAPGCGYCNKTLTQMRGLENEFTFNIIPLPIMGPRSEEAVKNISCHYESDPMLVLTALLAEDYSALSCGEQGPTQKQLEYIGRSVMAAQLFGINSVPVIIDSNKVISKGAPDSLAARLGK